MSEEQKESEGSSCSQESCSSCGSAGSCESAKKQGPLPDTHIKKLIGVVSGKGGVGKSLVTSLLASRINKEGLSSAILDADMTGPSIPHVFGLDDARLTADAEGMFPAETKEGIKILSSNLILVNNTDPVIWRGPVVSGAIQQFFNEAHWGDVDFMFVDMPPGTGDVPLTVFQSLPIDGIVIVATPQELVGMIVQKAVNMATKMNVPILALVENMSYLICPDCGNRLDVFGESHLAEIAEQHNITTTAQLPIDPAIAAACDAGEAASIRCPELDPIVDVLKKML